VTGLQNKFHDILNLLKFFLTVPTAGLRRPEPFHINKRYHYKHIGGRKKEATPICSRRVKAITAREKMGFQDRGDAPVCPQSNILNAFQDRDLV
jgi:hypothetical protein